MSPATPGEAAEPIRIPRIPRTEALSVVLVRHAERESTGSDPELTMAGRARAELLSRMLSEAGVRGVFVTEFHRSLQTGGPTATRFGLPLRTYDAADAAAVAAAVLDGRRIGTALVVAHSNTIGPIIAALGGPAVADLDEVWFDRMFVLGRRAGEVSFLRLRYGTATD